MVATTELDHILAVCVDHVIEANGAAVDAGLLQDSMVLVAYWMTLKGS